MDDGYSLDGTARSGIPVPRTPTEWRGLAHEVWAHRHRGGPMQLSTAMAINRAMLAIGFISNGIDGRWSSWPPFRELGITLAELVQVNEVIRAAEERTPAHGGWRSITVKCADRLVAAIYTIVHFQPSDDPIVLYGRQGLVVADEEALSRLRGDEDDSGWDDDDGGE